MVSSYEKKLNHMKSYEEYSKRLQLFIRKNEEQYYVNKLNSLGNDVKRNWKILNSLLNKSKYRSTTTVESPKTEQFVPPNTFF